MTTQEALQQWLDSDDTDPPPQGPQRPRWATYSTRGSQRHKAKLARRKAGRREL